MGPRWCPRLTTHHQRCNRIPRANPCQQQRLGFVRSALFGCRRLWSPVPEGSARASPDGVTSSCCRFVLILFGEHCDRVRLPSAAGLQGTRMAFLDGGRLAFCPVACGVGPCTAVFSARGQCLRWFGTSEMRRTSHVKPKRSSSVAGRAGSAAEDPGPWVGLKEGSYSAWHCALVVCSGSQGTVRRTGAD